MLITSSQNPKVQWVRKLLAQKKERDASSCYVLEGIRLAEEALQCDAPIRLAMYVSTVNQRAVQLICAVQQKGVEMLEVSESVMKSISDTGAPQGVLMVCEKSAPPFPAHPSFLLIADALHDPGNLGTLFRTASAAGVEGIILSPNCAEVYAPKVIRSTMGAHFRIPFVSMGWDEIHDWFRQHMEIRIFASDMEGGKSLWAQDLRSPCALIIGSEADGIGKEAERLAHDKIFIPMTNQVESLNAAVAASVLLFEVVRQRIAQ